MALVFRPAISDRDIKNMRTVLGVLSKNLDEAEAQVRNKIEKTRSILR
ncbi:MAG TPA: hypothetical protein VF906_02345 [Candidatus Bathyarchaeia archaeon]